MLKHVPFMWFFQLTNTNSHVSKKGRDVRTLGILVSWNRWAEWKTEDTTRWMHRTVIRMLSKKVCCLGYLYTPKKRTAKLNNLKNERPQNEKGNIIQSMSNHQFLGFHALSKVTRWVLFWLPLSALMIGTISSVGKQVQRVEVSLQESWGSVLSCCPQVERGQQPKPRRPKGSRVGLWFKDWPEMLKVENLLLYHSSEVWMMLLFDFWDYHGISLPWKIISWCWKRR